MLITLRYTSCVLYELRIPTSPSFVQVGEFELKPRFVIKLLTPNEVTDLEPH